MSHGNPQIQFLLTRRSIRKFKDEDVPLEILLDIVDVARWAPSSKNRQPWEFIVIRDRSILEKLSTFHPGCKPLSEAKAAIAVVGDPTISPNTYMVDCANATMYILLAAHALGLGAVWINTIGYEGMKDILKIPKDKALVSLVALGWPAEEPKPKPRKSLDEITYLNTYGNPVRKG